MDENAIVNCEAEENSKPQKGLFALLPVILPYLACALAALSLVFAFLIGVKVEQGGAVQTHYFYHYLGKAYSQLKQLNLPAEAYNTAKGATVLITVFSVFGLVCVLAFAALTCYFAVSKFVRKNQVSCEKPAIYTYFAYVLFAGVYYAATVGTSTVNGLKTGYGIATIIGIALTTLVFATYIAARTAVDRRKLANKVNRATAIYSLVRIGLLCAIIALGCTACATISFTNEQLSGQKFSGGFPQFAHFAATWESCGEGFVLKTGAKLALMSSASTVGFLVAFALVIVSSVLLCGLVTSPYGRKKSDGVFYAVIAALSLFYVLFCVLTASFVSDIVGITGTVTEDNELVIKTLDVQFGISVGGAIAVAALSVLSFVAAIAQSKIIAAATKERGAAAKSDAGDDVLLEVKNLCKYFVVGKDFFGRPTTYLKAVDGISFSLKRGKTLGIVGESGCGKSTMGRTILRLHDVTGGEVWFNGQKISDLSNSEFDKIRPNLQMIFQDPYASLSPRLTVGEIIGEAARQHGLVKKSEYHDYVLKIMEMCGLQPHYFERYPHEFSGGQRQRICIARALAMNPQLVVCDEPVSALDVSIQAQIINMLIDLRKRLSLTYIFISHDLSVVKHISDDVGVMYLGSIVEFGSKEVIFNNTLHPYTKALFSAVPVPDPHVKMNRVILKGDIPSPVNPPKGCKFHTRCDSCMEICSRIAPAYKEVESGHFCACHLYNTEDETRQLEEAYAQELSEQEPVDETFGKLKGALNVKKLFNRKKEEEADGEEE